MRAPGTFQLVRHTVHKSLLSRWPPIMVGALAVNNAQSRLRLSMGNFTSRVGATHSTFTTEESVRYIESVFDDYKRYGDIDRFHGRVAEVGPGDNAGVALLLRNEGCTQVDLVDRFRSWRDPSQQSKIYRALSAEHNLEDYHRVGEEWDGFQLSGVHWHIGEPAERYFEQYAGASEPLYDFIVSRAVLQHLYDPLSALTAMVACLRPGGKMVHKIDLRDLGLFSLHHHELAWLRTPSLIHRAMTSHSGYPNRVLVPAYRGALDDLCRQGLISYSFLVTRLVEVGVIDPPLPFDRIAPTLRKQACDAVQARRQGFATEFSGADTSDLAITGFFLRITRL